MTLLTPEPPLAGLDIVHGAARLVAADPGRLTWLAPWPGAEDALSAALAEAHGLALPAPGEATAAAGARCLWAGRAQALLVGPAPSAGLAAHGAAIDVTDGWAALTLTGPAAPDVLARLVPVDLRPAAFPPGRCARAPLGHMAALVVALDDGVELFAMRSMADTAAHEVAEAMRAVAARALLS